jgi:signal transduction histidine kinase
MLIQRLHASGEVDGSGGGLAICQKLLGRMGGRIWVDSTPGNGSTFYFSLPESPPTEIFSASENGSTRLAAKA